MTVAGDGPGTPVSDRTEVSGVWVHTPGSRAGPRETSSPLGTRGTPEVDDRVRPREVGRSGPDRHGCRVRGRGRGRANQVTTTDDDTHDVKEGAYVI